jgi:hypothetical protein
MVRKKTEIKLGNKFGKLTIVKDLGMVQMNNRTRHCAIVKCACGFEKLARVSSLTTGAMKSCGCTAHEKLYKFVYKHGMHETKIFKLWSGMFSRCYNTKHLAYKYYGKRGILICKRWHKFVNFYADMGDRPNGKTLDRINNDKGYSPSNCKWSTYKEQANNRSNSVK